MGKTLSKRYKILDKVGDGGMALVYKAKDMLLGRLVAIKVLREQYAGDREFVERFRREAQAAASLSHANVVNIYDVGQEDGIDYIVMEYVEGRNLKDIIREKGALPISVAVDIARQVALALDHAHRHRLVHRDIKPHNILITEDNQVKVTDFGIALAASYSQLTQSGFVVGTAHYFSPEQAKGGMATAQSDLYSLGVVLYEMLTGRLPFTGDTPVAVALQHVQEPIRPPRALRPEISPEINRIVLKALSKIPAERYQSAAEMASDLQKAAAGFGNGNDTGEYTASDATKVISVVEHDEKTAIRQLEVEDETIKREEKQLKKRKRRRGLYIFLFMIIFLGAIMWAASKLPELIFPEEVVVPNVVGKTQSEARKILEERGLKLAVDREIFSDEVPAGQVVSQEPEANRRVKMYRTVLVEVSKGPRLIEVPSVVGLSIRDARLRITQAGLSVGRETATVAPDVPIEHVVAQTPEAGSYLKEGLPVDLVVSRQQAAEETVVLPDLRNMALENAKARLIELGLTLGNVWADASYSVPQGHVISQNPPPGTHLAPGESVDFVYSQGRPGTNQPEGKTPPAGNVEPDEGSAEEEPVPESDRVGPGVETGEGENVQTPSQSQSGGDGAVGSGEGSDQASLPSNTKGQATEWKQADVRVNIPAGPEQEVVLIVVDALGAREVYRGTHKGGTAITRRVVGKGTDARIQVYIDNTLVAEQSFPG